MFSVFGDRGQGIEMSYPGESVSTTAEKPLIPKVRQLTEEETLIVGLRELTALKRNEIYKEPVEQLIKIHEFYNAFFELEATKTLLEKEITSEELEAYQKATEDSFRSLRSVTIGAIRGVLMIIYITIALATFTAIPWLLLLLAAAPVVVIAGYVEDLRQQPLVDAVYGIVQTVEKQLRPDQVVTEANVEPVAEETSRTLMIRSF